MNIQVPHEVKNQCALTKRISQIITNGQDVIIQIGSFNRCSVYSKHIPYLMHMTHVSAK